MKHWLPTLLLGGIVLTIIALASVLSCEIEDLHLVNRIGAALAAIGALAVLIQVQKEEQYQAEDETDENFSVEGNSDSVLRAMAEKAYRFRKTDRHKRRRRIVGQIAMVLFLAEITHGWGDRILEEVCPVAHGEAENEAKLG